MSQYISQTCQPCKEVSQKSNGAKVIRSCQLGASVGETIRTAAVF